MLIFSLEVTPVERESGKKCKVLLLPWGSNNNINIYTTVENKAHFLGNFFRSYFLCLGVWVLVVGHSSCVVPGHFTLKALCLTYGNPRQSWILDSTLWILDSLSVDLGSQLQSTPDNSKLQGKTTIRLELWGVEANSQKWGGEWMQVTWSLIYTQCWTPYLNGTEKSADKDSLHVLSGAWSMVWVIKGKFIEMIRRETKITSESAGGSSYRE